jgi:hypothetical protein
MASSADSAKASSARKGRNDSPAPKAKAGSKAEDRGKAALAGAAAAPKPAESQAKAEDTRLICGLHPEAFRVLILGPVAVGAVIASTVFFDVGKITIAFVTKQWSAVSGPVGTFLGNNSDLIVACAAAAAFAPLALVFAITVLRAFGDVKKFSVLQQVLFYILVVGALATLVTTEGTLWTFDQVRAQWDKVSDPIEEILATKSDSILAGAAIFCLTPVAAAALTYAIRALWGCRCKIVVPEATK